MTEERDNALSARVARFRRAVSTAFRAPTAGGDLAAARPRRVSRWTSVVAAVAVVGTTVAGIAWWAAPADRQETSATATPSAGTSSSTPASTGPASREPTVPQSTTGPARSQPGKIRGTDWRNAAVKGLKFCLEVVDDVVEFRNGSNGLDIPCKILPGGARPVYAEFLVEEPANRPATEDALVLVELGNPDAARRQALVPVALGADGRTLVAWPAIEGDQPSPMGDQVMTFTSYHVEQEVVVATVKGLDGTPETRRYRQAGMFGPWERF